MKLFTTFYNHKRVVQRKKSVHIANKKKQTKYKSRCLLKYKKQSRHIVKRIAAVKTGLYIEITTMTFESNNKLFQLKLRC